jgi:hypothetical protein
MRIGIMGVHTAISAVCCNPLKQQQMVKSSV